MQYSKRLMVKHECHRVEKRARERRIAKARDEKEKRSGFGEECSEGESCSIVLYGPCYSGEECAFPEHHDPHSPYKTGRSKYAWRDYLYIPLGIWKPYSIQCMAFDPKTLPDEMWGEVMSHLDDWSLDSFMRTCIHFYSLRRLITANDLVESGKTRELGFDDYNSMMIDSQREFRNFCLSYSLDYLDDGDYGDYGYCNDTDDTDDTDDSNVVDDIIDDSNVVDDSEDANDSDDAYYAYHPDDANYADDAYHRYHYL